MSLARVLRLRVAHGLAVRRPLLFLSGCNGIYTGLESAPTIFLAPNPGLPALLTQIQDATTAQQNVGKLKGAVAVREAKFSVLLTSIESEVTYVQGLCDASPALGPSIVSAAAMKAELQRGYQKPLLKVKTILPSGSVLLDANASLLDSTHRAKFFCWQHTLDGKTWIPMPPTQTGKTTVSGLPTLILIGFQVAVAVHGQPQGPWSPTVSIVVL